MNFKIVEYSSDYILGFVECESEVKKISFCIENQQEIKAKLIKTQGKRTSFFVDIKTNLTGFYNCFLEIETGENIKTITKSKEMVFLNKKEDIKQAVGPFPKDVEEILFSLRKDYIKEEGFDKNQTGQAVKDILKIYKNSKTLEFFPIYKYLMFLKAMKHKFLFIEKNFPRLNPHYKDLQDKDSASILTSFQEMITIANHLYVLKSYGIKGDLFEFGCFRGFSSSCLSHACFELGINLVVFDSFLGLPKTNSNYYKEKDFYAPFEEVKENIKTFGAYQAVKFVRGFYQDSVFSCKRKPALIWMDLDLSCSARFALKFLTDLDEKSGVFSNETLKEYFQGNKKVICKKNEDEPVSEIIRAFEDNDKELRGDFLCKDTGFFYEKDKAKPILLPKYLKKIIRVI